ncbi:fatty acid-binding protein DegV [Terribacillus saccharophilus]|jgi:DegV family protein with EDD domain|uniref:Fatty acid-binding protein DegV n=1 Tax=Terribacillus saccharophilus TaxID=361277 RepID=A0A268HGP4_9BACI|nr:DegV family protein [Terribacillus saccharophilus]PAD35900.1 fatty acid-binding protein DegV [Terribacillus saccharophilus]PAD97050.1 fatty acid-binding protein DegV [Terribacillus saccharophilus]PAE00626.1 fatty acid-binding protein DegV [Terribacillus saccharophilus]PAE09049.1 fatty acid-binding protein DegV [Terribacillus saccharophilus]
MKIAVMTDSTAYLTPEQREAFDIHMIPLQVVFDDATYEEEVDITASEFYDKVKQQKALPKTSQPVVGKVIEKLEELSESYDAVISVHLSSGISGTYQSMVAADDMVEGIDVYAYDSELSCMAQGYYALEAARMVKQGASVEEILKRMDEMKETMIAYFIVDDLTNLQRGGRLNGAQAIIGSLLQVKPVLHFEDKRIVPFEKIRTKKKAISRIKALLAEQAADGAKMKACLLHGNRPEEAETLRGELAAEFPNVEVEVSYFGPVIATHLGEGAIGLLWYKV